MSHTRQCKRKGCKEHFKCRPTSNKMYCSLSCGRIRKVWTVERMNWIRANRDKMTITQMAAHFEVDAHVLSKAVSDYRRNDPSMPYLLKSLVGSVRIRTSGYGVEFKYTKEADGKWSRVKTGEDKRRKATRVKAAKVKPVKPPKIEVVKVAKSRQDYPRQSSRKPQNKVKTEFFEGKLRINTRSEIRIRESKTIPPDKVAVRINSKTIVWRDKNKVA